MDSRSGERALKGRSSSLYHTYLTSNQQRRNRDIIYFIKSKRFWKKKFSCWIKPPPNDGIAKNTLSVFDSYFCILLHLLLSNTYESVHLLLLVYGSSPLINLREDTLFKNRFRPNFFFCLDKTVFQSN